MAALVIYSCQNNWDCIFVLLQKGKEILTAWYRSGLVAHCPYVDWQWRVVDGSFFGFFSYWTRCLLIDVAWTYIDDLASAGSSELLKAKERWPSDIDGVISDQITGPVLSASKTYLHCSPHPRHPWGQGWMDSASHCNVWARYIGGWVRHSWNRLQTEKQF